MFWQGVAATGFADIVDEVSVAVNTAAELMIADIPQVQMLDVFSLSAVSFHHGRGIFFLKVC